MYTANLLKNFRFSGGLGSWEVSGDVEILSVDNLWKFGGFVARVGDQAKMTQVWPVDFVV